MIEVAHLTKRFGPTLAIDDLSFVAGPGRVTGFLGPNGAGKTTTMRTLLGLVAPTSGSATVAGRRYAELDDPVRTVGAVLEAASFHPGRTGRDHLRVLTAAAGLPDRRADEVLAMVGMEPYGDRRVGGYSLGMRQRLALAAALLGDPQVLLLDEPANGLDPEGIRWLRTLLRSLAGSGRTVLVSSHVLSEVAQTVDDVVIVDRGRLVAHRPLDEVVRRLSSVRARSPQADRLAELLRARGATVVVDGDGLRVEGLDAPAVGEVAASASVVLHELSPATGDLESAFLALTGAHEAGSAP